MFALGTLFIGNFNLWITTPIFSLDPKDSRAEHLPYFEVLLSEKKDMLYYIDLHKDSRFDFINFRCLPKELKTKTKKNKFGEEEIIEEKDSLEESIYRYEYEAWSSRKETAMQQPLWKLSRSTIEKLINRCQELTK